MVRDSRYPNSLPSPPACTSYDSEDYIGDGHPTFNRNPYNGYINPYYWVDDHPLLYGNNGSLDPGTYVNIYIYTPGTQNLHFKMFESQLESTIKIITNGWNSPNIHPFKIGWLHGTRYASCNSCFPCRRKHAESSSRFQRINFIGPVLKFYSCRRATCIS